MRLFSIVKQNNHILINFFGIKIKIKRKLTKKDYSDYANYALNSQLDKSNFINLSNKKYSHENNPVKLISFYLPQFHDFEENLKWFGRGFSEWQNTSKAVPQYVGHYQPHIPIDVGYYNLENNETIKRQIELAKQYGIYGFGFYYYWYSGKKVMDKPINNFLQDKSLDMPFFIFWANQDWTMNWDNGDEKQILHKQELNENDAQKFMQDVLPFMKDERYIKIDNKPLLIIYIPEQYTYEKFIDFNTKIRQIAKENGFNDLYLMTTIFRAKEYNKNYKAYTDKYNFDALFEFFPQGINEIEAKQERIINPLFKGACFDIKKYIKEKKYLYKCNATLFKGLFPHWDNTPRKCYKGALIYENSPEFYKDWLKNIINWTRKNNKKNEQFVFINAWNEWAEGAHLEPDQKYGYAYLQKTKEALIETENIE